MKKILILYIFNLIFFSVQSQQQEVVLSSRLFHPRNDRDTLSTIKAINDFRPGRIDWMYCDNPSQLAQLKKLGIRFSLATHPEQPDSLVYTTKKLRILDRFGQPVIATWMKEHKGDNRYWGCVNNPGFKQLFVTYAKKLVDLGAYAIFVDDCLFNFQGVSFGGCYCEYCMAGFSNYLESNGVAVEENFNLRKLAVADSAGASLKYGQLFKNYQEQSVLDFYHQWMEQIRAYSNHQIKFLCNNYKGFWLKIYQVFDGGICEVEGKDVNFKTIDRALQTAKQLGKTQAFNFETDDENQLYGAILYAYVNGAEALLPWDTWIQEKSKGANIFRFYGKRENYDDLLYILNNVILNSQFVQQTQSQVPKKLGLPSNDFINYRYSNGKEAYNLLFNKSYSESAFFKLKSNRVSRSSFNVNFKKHYKLSASSGSELINSTFLIIKE